MDIAIPSFTILRVKRKLNPDESSSYSNPDDNRFQSFKRLRHIGSFSSTTRPDEDTLVKNNLLKQFGLDTSTTTTTTPGTAKKRVKISDLNSEQFQAVVERLEEEKNNPSKKKKQSSKEEEEVDNQNENNADPDNNNGIFNIKLTEDDLAVQDKENRNHRKETESITCNGHLLEVVDNVPKEEEYVFDYYVYTEDLLLDDGFDVPPEGAQDAVDEDSNDENYRYNDYPDEDDFTDKEDDDHSDNSERSDNYGDDDDEGVNVYGFRQFDYDEEREYYDADDDEDEDICAQFDRKMQLEKILKKNADNDSDDDDLDDDDVDDGLMV